ncbi:MAG: twin-arginine translocation signal domain-containing protein [Bacteroidales bacterium]|jgi:L-alanine-DL-glutamate epimerase-like enolase superfamily enzyme|nr:twin-arginine translocation signal domain-containing protein [Bacteroidales bacterium]MCH3940239.1 twin-arginine translocation signal domain-containing protein [Bacteroidales bacterium]MCI2136449.1 twin-arginine translocation signal domain-containing protein [Bacteroidales bacterium]MDY6320628.1 enolase C-terminal domain-like protein [Bacteroidales bacterium]MDY6377086.1 enolase C-terminal domain-like protein [Bacteroidales bacterium]
MRRRDFIKTAGLATAAIGTANIASACGNSTNDNVPRPYDVNMNGGARMRLSFEPYELQLRHTFTVASYSRKTTPDVQVKIEYDGFTGYGEASMPPYLGQSVETVTKFLQKVNLEQFKDPFQTDDILTYVDGIGEGDTAAKAAVDIALHDLVGKLMGEPWYRIWGLNPGKAPNTTFTIGIDAPDVVREKTTECADKFKILKVKVGLDNDEQMIRAIREVTDLPVAVDANQGWKDREKALDEIFWLKEHGVVMVEQPMPKERLDDNAWLTERSPVPIFADEAIQRLKDIPSIRGAYAGINIKLMKCTGMREAWKMLNYARAEGMKVMVGCMTETSCAVSAAAQLSPAVDFADLDGNLLISNDRFEGMTVVDGKITLPDRPGIGLKLL